MPTLINSMQAPNPLGKAISDISGNMFNNGAAVALRRMQIQGLQREGYGIEGLSKLYGDSSGGVVNPQDAARFGVLGGLGPDKVAGYQRFLAGINTGPRSDLTTNADAAAGDYDKSAANLDLNRKNAFDMGTARNATSVTNTDTRVGGMERIATGRNAAMADKNTADIASREKIASMGDALHRWQFNNKPVAGNVDGKPGFVRQGDSALAPIIDQSQMNAVPFAQKTSAVESAGDPNAQNPNSSATGSQQFTDRTWMDVVRKHAPELLQGRTVSQVLDLRKDPELAGVMANKYGEDNGAVLQSQGLPVTDGTKYLAHFLGPGGAVKALKADPNTPLSALLDPDAIRANPQLASMTAGGVRAWADKKMGMALAPQGQPPVAQAPVAQIPAALMPAAQPPVDQQPVQVAQADGAQVPPQHTVTPIIKGPQAMANLPMPDPLVAGADGEIPEEAKKAYLAALTPSDRANALNLTSGAMLPEQVQLQGGARNRAVALATGYDPNYNVSRGKARADLLKSEMGGGKVGSTMTALDQATGHMGDYLRASQGLHDTGYAQINHPYNSVMGQNKEANAASTAALGPMASEIESVFRSSAGTLEGVNKIISSLSQDMPQPVRAEAIKTLGGMFKDRIKSLANQHLDAYGNLDNFPIPDVRAKLQALGVDTKDLDPIYTAAKNHGGMNVDKLPGGLEDPALAAPAAGADGWKLAPDGKTKIRLKQ
ncbi:MAG: hypothetical protein ABJA10_06685 [Aestuariivirga sp.]